MAKEVGKTITYTPPAKKGINKTPINADDAAAVAKNVDNKKKVVEKVEMYRAAYNIPKTSKLNQALKAILYELDIPMQDYSIAILCSDLIKRGKLKKEDAREFFDIKYHYLLEK